MSADKNNQILAAMIGGGNGGKYIATATANAAMDFLYLAEATTFTTLTDADDTNLITSKAISGVELAAGTILHAGEGTDGGVPRIKAVSYSGGSVIGYTVPSSSIDFNG